MTGKSHWESGQCVCVTWGCAHIRLSLPEDNDWRMSVLSLQALWYPLLICYQTRSHVRTLIHIDTHTHTEMWGSVTSRKTSVICWPAHWLAVTLIKTHHAPSVRLERQNRNWTANSPTEVYSWALKSLGMESCCLFVFSPRVHHSTASLLSLIY